MREADYKNNGERLKHRMARGGLGPHGNEGGFGGGGVHVYCKPSLGSNFIVLFVSTMPLYV